ncbi:MAG: hypothetical protein J6P93_03845 [Alphaproteobacteria bacterium]|nr:hypothetical protein [Alphaproteobacteria bacterium]
MAGIIDMIKSGVLSEESLIREIKDSVAKGWNVNQKDECGCRPLMLTESPKVAKELIASGADVNAEDNHGNTALRWAKAKGNDGVVTVLIAAGARQRS